MAEFAVAEFKDEEVRDFMKAMYKNLKSVNQRSNAYVGLLSGIVFRDVLTHFEQEKGSKGKWEKWSDSYTVYMREIGREGNKILQFSGKLRQNFKPTDYKTASAGITWFNDAKVKGGFPYAAAHDEGGGRLPKRDFMWLSEKALEEISEQTLKFMMDEDI